MKEYLKPDVEVVSFATETVTSGLDQGVILSGSKEDGSVDL